MPAGRKARFAIVAVWLLAIFAIFGADLPAKFTDAENNESSSYLPGDAESTLALEAAEQLTDGEQAGIVVVYRRDGRPDCWRPESGSPADVKRLNREIDGVSRPFERGPVAEDGSAALVFSSITATGEADDLLDPVAAVRDAVSTDNYDAAGDLQVAVTGAAGYSADAVEVFESINGTLFVAAFGLVFLLLILIYRSPILLWFPLLAVGFAEIATRAIGFGLTEAGVTVNGQSSSILSVLVLGAGTDYALLLISRYREELRRQENREAAMRVALSTAGPAILASGGTVIAALLCLGLADLNSTASLGPIGAIGIATRDGLDAHLPARAAGDRSALRLLAPGAARRRPGHRRHPRSLAPARRPDRRPSAPGLDRHPARPAGDGRRHPRLRRRPDLLERLPRRRRGGPGAGSDRPVVPRRRQRADRDHRRRPGRGSRGRRSGRGSARRRVGAARDSEARGPSCSTPCCGRTPIRPRPST